MIAVGRVARPHGVRGEVAVDLLTEVPERFEPGSTLQTEHGSPLTVESARPHQGRLLVVFEGVADRTGADALRGVYLFVHEDDLPVLPDGRFWPHQLEGCEVVDEDGRAVGRLAEVLAGPESGNDVWAVDGEGGRVLIPAVRDAVVSVDIDGRRVVVRAEALA
jgi:16S rRNA processing protein RimM